MGINDPKKLTSTHRQAYNDRKSAHLFKTPSIPIRKRKKNIKNKLEINHHNYNSVVHKDFRSTVITNKLSSYTTSTLCSSKSENRRKHYKRSHISTRHLIVTPASTLIFNMTKRSREEYNGSIYNPKRQRMEARTFQIEPIDQGNELCLKELFCTDNMTHHNVPIKFPDQNENLLTAVDDLSEYKKRVLATVHSNLIDIKSKIEPVVIAANVNMLNECKNVALKLQRITSPIDVKFDTNNATELQDNKVSAMNAIETQYATAKKETCDHTLWKQSVNGIKEVKPAVVVKKEIDETDNMDRSCESSSSSGEISTTYPGQLLWAQYNKYPYWPAIVCVPASEATKGQIEVKFFAYKGRSGKIKKENAVLFQGIDSFVEYRKAMESKLSKSKWKTAFSLASKATMASWSRAVIEITFVQSKDLNARLALFDIIVICTLRDQITVKNPPSLSKLIAEHSSSSQLDAVQSMFADNSKIFDDVKQSLAEISSQIDTERFTLSTSISAAKTKSHTPVPASMKQSAKETTNGNRRQSLPTSLAKRRASPRIASIVPSILSVSLPIEPEKQPQKYKDKDPDRIKRKEEKRMEFEKALELYTGIARQKDILFKGLRRGNVCKQCLTVDEKLDRDLVKCSGVCVDHVHRKCARTTKGSNEVRCNECSDSSSHVCYVCKKQCSESAMVRCVVKACGRYYHSGCLDDWLQTKTLEPGKVMCPTHTCHTCASDDPRNTHFSCSKDTTLSRCIKCPTTFHADSNCIPAGVRILTGNQHICIRHRKETKKPVSLNWCYICGGTGGKFLCCESCPLTSHFKCLRIEDAGEHYFCDSCETGRHPLHGEVVWAKFSNYRWWPAVIVPPACVPSLMKDKANEHEICVRFFGTYEFGWVGRSFVYLYDEGDAQRSGKTKYDEAVEQAEKWYKTLAIKVKKSENIQPLPYSKIRKIKKLAPARLTRSERCDPDPCSCSPDDADPCGPTSNCEKREAWTECDPSVCPTGDKCQNQCIAKQKYASFSLKHVGDKGFGLIAETAICPGTMVIEYVGELITEEEYNHRVNSKNTPNFYFMKYGKGLYIDAEKRGNMSRFINHSCNPNCQPRVIEVKGFERIGLIATKNIKKGEELTFNYEFDVKDIKCYCGEAQCRGYI